MNAPTPITCPRDFIPLIPQTLGYLPHESLVILPISGVASGAIMRVDLPPAILAREAHHVSVDRGTVVISESHDAHAFSQVVTEHVARLRDCTSAVICVFTDTEPHCLTCDIDAECERGAACVDFLPAETIIDALEEAMMLRGVRLLSALVVSGDRWFDYWSTQQGSVADALGKLPRTASGSFRDRAHIEPAGASAIEYVSSLCEQQTALTLPTDDEVLCAWNLLVDGDDWIADAHHTTLYAVVLMGLQSPRVTECILANAAYGQDAADEMGRIWDALAAEIPDSEMQGMTAARTEYDPVDQDRSVRATGVLKNLVAHARGDRKVAAYAVLAWVEWCRGSSSLAHHYANEALRDGAHELASQVYELVQSGALPGWIDGSSCLGPIRDADVDRILQW